MVGGSRRVPWVWASPAAAALLALLFLPAPAAPDEGRAEFYSAVLTGGQEDPPNGSLAQGRVGIRVRGGRMHVRVEWEGLSGPVTGAHLHGSSLVGDVAPIVFDLVPGRLAPGSSSPLEADFDIDHAQRGLLAAGLFRADLHTATYPAGEVRGQVVPGSAD